MDCLVQVCQGEARDKHRKFRFKHPLLTLDSTVIPVCVEMFEWAKYVKTKGAVKLHTVLDNVHERRGVEQAMETVRL